MLTHLNTGTQQVQRDCTVTVALHVQLTHTHAHTHTMYALCVYKQASQEECSALAAMIEQLMLQNADMGSKLNAKSSALELAHAQLAHRQVRAEDECDVCIGNIIARPSSADYRNSLMA